MIITSKTITFILIASGTVIGLAGTDLVLPAIPGLPEVLTGNAKTAQWVLAAFAGGTGLGLLAYGELGTRFKIGNLLISSLFGYAIISVLATYASTLYELSFIRFFQGFVAAAPAVFAPVMIKSMYEEQSTVAMLGRIGSIESLAPALAPIIGAWLLSVSGWKSSFYVTAAIAFLLGLIWILRRKTRLSFGYTKRSEAGYFPLLLDSNFMRYALSQAFTLGALLIIVFAAPTIIINSMNGELADFIIMQVLGISFFIVSANYSHILVTRLGVEKTILAGSGISAFGCIGIFCMGLASNTSIELLWFLFIFVNTGLGVRAPPGFYKALLAAGSNEARGSALVVLFIMFTAALGTAAIAPLIDGGLLPIGALASCVSIASTWLSFRVANGRAKPLPP